MFSRKRNFRDMTTDYEPVMKRRRVMNSDEETNVFINVMGNNIYYYADFNEKSCFELVTHLRTLEMKLQKKKDKVINLHINSYGGDLMCALTIINTIKSLTVPVHSYVDGYAASSGTLISVVCDKRFMYKHSRMLIHQLSTGLIGNFETLLDDFKDAEELMDVIKGIYTKHTNLTKGKLTKILKRDVWWNSKICLENGLVDKIL